MKTFKQEALKATAKMIQDELGCSLIEAVSKLQASAAKAGNTEILDDLCEFKAELIGL